jgi:hypothetical protein
MAIIRPIIRITFFSSETCLKLALLGEYALIWRKAGHPTAQSIPRDFGANAWRIPENSVSSHGLDSRHSVKIG